MRAALFRWILTRLERHTPDILCRLEAQILTNLAASGFERPGRSVWRLPAPEALRAYAAYTAECMTKTEADPRLLYDSALRLGRRLRHITGLTEREDVQRLIFYLYRNIRITMRGDLPGEITVPSCYFSGFYLPEQCKLMSNVDAGIIVGLSGGGELQFIQRLTEGCGQCKAIFLKEVHKHE